MTRITSTFGLLMLLTLMSGCTVANIVKTEKDELLLIKIDELRHLIEQEEWNDVSSNITNFEGMYEQRKWKLQLLSALSDYKDIELEVELLKENVKDEDEIESLIRLRQIQYRLSVIYNM